MQAMKQDRSSVPAIQEESTSLGGHMRETQGHQNKNQDGSGCFILAGSCLPNPFSQVETLPVLS